MLGGLLAQIIPIGLLGALAPTRIIVAIALLTSAKPMRKASAFLAGLAGFYLVIGFIALLFFGRALSTSSKGATISATILTVVGVFLLAFGIRGFFSASDPDAPPPGWMQRIKTITTGQAFLLGLLLAFSIKYLMIFLGGVDVIYDAQVLPSQRVIILLVLIVLTLLGPLIPVALYASNPTRAGVQLRALMEWLDQHNRVIMMVVSFVLGTFFLVKGLNGLI